MTRGAIAADWWRVALADRNSGAARGVSARLRRGSALEVLTEPQVQGLARRLRMTAGEAGDLVRLAQVLADLRENDGATLARHLGGAVLSPLRFQRLMRAQGDEFTTQLRRAIVMAGRRCKVAQLAQDVLDWDDPERGDQARARWCFDYFGGSLDEVPQKAEETAE